MSEEFWNEYWSRFSPEKLDLRAVREKAGPSVRALLERIGDVAGLSVLDLGCGNGLLSVYLAKSGACVTAVDLSHVSIRNTIALAQTNGVSARVQARVGDAAQLKGLDQSFDLVTGQFILHHIEPFGAFVDVLFDLTARGGRGVFLENSSRNPVLAFSRAFLVGKLGIPKYGDAEEHPLEPREIDLLARRFEQVDVHFPEFLFFRLIGPYLLRRELVPGSGPERIDNWIHHHLRFLRRYSYRQIVEFRKT